MLRIAIGEGIILRAKTSWCWFYYGNRRKCQPPPPLMFIQMNWREIMCNLERNYHANMQMCVRISERFRSGSMCVSVSASFTRFRPTPILCADAFDFHSSSYIFSNYPRGPATKYWCNVTDTLGALVAKYIQHMFEHAEHKINFRIRITERPSMSDSDATPHQSPEAQPPLSIYQIKKH